LSKVIQRAARFQKQGKLDKAADVYEAILAEEPKHFEATQQLGILRYQQGYTTEALEYLSAAVRLKPSDIGILTNFGNILASVGKTDEALAHYDRALAIDADHPETLYNRGNVLRELKRPKEALAGYDRAIAVKPQFAEAHNNRGNVLRDLKRPQEALIGYSKAISLKPHLIDALYNQGNAFKELGRPEEALASYKKALAINPNFAEGHITCGDLLKLLNREKEALASYDRAITISPKNAAAHIVRGDLIKELNRSKEALASYDRAVAINPDHAIAHDRRGIVLMDLGRLAEAKSAHEHAIKLAPRSAPFYYNLTALTQLRIGDPLADALKELARDVTSLDWQEQIPLHFAMAKMFADNADYKRSFRHLLGGNAMKRKHTDYDESATLSDFDNLRAIFTSKLMRANDDTGEPSCVPVFVLGMPRSGTTLVEQILSSHPDAFGAGEIPDFINAAVEVGGPNLEALDFSEAASGMLRDQLRQIGENYMDRIGRTASKAKRIINKMPDNFRLVGLIRLALPNARIIHTCRDPVDTCLSCFSTLFAGNLPYAYDLEELGRYYCSYDKLMSHWRNVLPANGMLDIQYEDLVADVEGQARRIVAHCGLKWDARCLNFHQTDRPVRTASAVQVRQPIYKTSIERWRKYEPFLGPLLAALGPLVADRFPKRVTRVGIASQLDKVADLFRSVTSKLASSPSLRS